MVGKSTSGRGATGSKKKARIPARASAIVRSEVATGRLINGAERFTKTPRAPVRLVFHESVHVVANGSDVGRAGQRRGRQPELCRGSIPGLRSIRRRS